MMPVKVNVLFLLNSLCFGGAEKHVISLLNGLDKNKFGLSLGYLKDNTTLLSQIETKNLNDVFCCHVAKKIDFTALKQIAQHVDEHDVDIIVSTNEYPLIYSFLTRFLSKRKPAMLEVFHTTEQFGLKNKLKMLVYRPLFRVQAKLVYVCEAQRSYWRKKGLRAQADMVIHNGVDTAHFRDVWPDEQKAAIRSDYGIATTDYLIGICAALRSEKAHTDLLKALRLLKQSDVPVKCLIIGDGVERKNIERQVINLGLEHSVVITGYQEDVRPLITACDVMAIVSHTETFSIAALEAMSLGKPMVMSDIGGAREQVTPGYNGQLFQAGDIDGLVMALADLSDAGKRSLFGERCRESVVNQFSLQGMVDRFEEVLMQTGTVT
ncbi:MAG: glycosyltransferase [Flavobacteriales bacterium]|nr:glycosyltransferase [Flavobacteriales bacterium]